MPADDYRLVQLANGTHTVYSSDYAEKMHPGLGPAAEAELLYVRQLKIPERMRTGTGAFVVWDVGLGAASNAIAVLRATRDVPRPLHLSSFDDTDEPLRFALNNAGLLGYFQDYETPAGVVLKKRLVSFQNGQSHGTWEFHVGDFPAWLEREQPGQREGGQLQAGGESTRAPDAILFDAFSPARNPAMWTLPLFTNLFRWLDSERPCNLTTFSRSTLLRATLLLAGFFVGRGVATGLKEETTVAANRLSLLDEPLDQRWLERARRSDSAEPLHAAVYRRSPLSAKNWEKLRAHPQFSG